MLKRLFRVNRSGLELFFKKRGVYRKGKLVTMRFCANYLKNPRFAFIVSGPKKSAVPRNLARRRMSDIVRRNIAGMPAGTDMAFFLKLGKDKNVPSYKILEEDILNVRSQINL